MFPDPRRELTVRAPRPDGRAGLTAPAGPAARTSPSEADVEVVEG